MCDRLHATGEKKRKEEKAARKAAKRQKKEEEAAGGAADGGAEHPWRPFDRERDLELRPKAKSGSDIVRSAAALGAKFSGGGVQRHFL
ncbi:hypothetical protein GPECTOR_3g346 [Gonium pectorale]|uniref:DUF3752 domain-containing protein n=1 Tax=Gonium pectorale TaxID=33097 RepID=A0A150GZQ5_GONPE|nr:hypothetical protein GPECTOR_3g346 [Gonium pectorale]|eukprot:KXZ55202.1 hypothetical protein GPECTOR_3g346 [Gonium pectorale]